ncbi:unannotated protein [freshwater metagenome]|uniref:Unannotated protein n=1 Tax=freshwater metagenome TaxID=449393 RepID=A0A6J7MCE2_9ZZZZ
MLGQLDDGSTNAKVSKSRSIPSKLSIPLIFLENAKSDINFTICARVAGSANIFANASGFVPSALRVSSVMVGIIVKPESRIVASGIAIGILGFADV